MRLLRLSGRKVCERVKTKGFLWKGKHCFARFLLGAPRNTSAFSSQVSAIYVGTLTSAKLDKSAVKRNRMRRRCREALRLTLKTFSLEAISDQRSAISGKPHAVRCPLSAVRSFQLLLLPRSSSLSADFGELLKDAEHLFASLQSRGR